MRNSRGQFIRGHKGTKKNKGSTGKHWKQKSETIKKKRDFMMGKKTSLGKKWTMSDKGKENIRQAHYGNKNTLGKHWKVKDTSKMGTLKGEMNPQWRGGVSFEKYPVDWTETLKRSIRERDRYTCRVCGEPQKEMALDVHHIDHNKKNCDPENLVSLCKHCHMKIHRNHG